MALSKTINLPSGVSGNYIRLTSYRWDRTTREASAMFSLYLDASKGADLGAQPLVPIVSKLRLVGDKFDHYLGPAALELSDVLAQLYLAAKVEPGISDYGADVLADAADC